MNYTPTMDGRHKCPGCTAWAAHHRLACPPCWRRLPPRIQTGLLVTHWAKDDAGHLAALRAARTWLALNPGRAEVLKGGFSIW
jgi:hypothetical protein